MAGLVFIRTQQQEELRRFYTRRVGMQVWLEQPRICILNHENLLVGFQEADLSDIDTLLTFFYPTREQVDSMYREFSSEAVAEPQENEAYQIYNFFARDPEGRRIEFQSFLHEIDIPALRCTSFLPRS